MVKFIKSPSAAAKSRLEASTFEHCSRAFAFHLLNQPDSGPVALCHTLGEPLKGFLHRSVHLNQGRLEPGMRQLVKLDVDVRALALLH